MKDPGQEFDEELQFHLDARTRDYVAKGMTPDAARAAATERLGDVTGIRKACTSVLAAERATERRRTMIKVSWLDVRLGLRMFARYPGLSLVSVVAMAVAIAVSAGYFGLVGTMLDSHLPFDTEGRAVATGEVPAEDFRRWSGELRSIVDLGAFREEPRNLITADGRVHLVDIALVTASGFTFTGVAPALGRSLLPQDEQASAPPVLVIAFEEWQRRFNGDPGVLGQGVRLDETRHTIVGVMPEGFGFPINHRYWAPLRLEDEAAARAWITVFGRLAPGRSLADARAELAAVTESMAGALLETHRDVRPQVQPYTRAMTGLGGPEAELLLRGLQYGIGLLLLVVAVNVSILVYARTAARRGEIAIRTALGAGRARVVTQLFVEALVPAVAAAAIGLGLIGVALRLFSESIRNSSRDRVPYWITESSFEISLGVVLYSAALGLVAAVIVGVLPGLKATGRRLQSGLQQLSARGAGLQLGRTWTALIVLQVALAVAVLPAAIYKVEGTYRIGMREAAPAAEPLLRADLGMSGPQERAVFAARMTAWMDRLGSEPGIAAVTFADRFAGEEQPVHFEVEPARTGTSSTGAGHQPTLTRGRVNRVAVNLFDVVGARLLAGRGFTESDAAAGATAVIVDQAFAERLAGDGGVLGRRLRYSHVISAEAVEQSPWFEIVGVVTAFADALAPPASSGGPVPRLYQAASPGAEHPATVIVRVRDGDPRRFTQRLTDITASVHPALKLERLEGVVHEFEQSKQGLRYLSLGLTVVVGSVLLLSAAGVYAMLSFTIVKRRREIGIRAALGADARRLLTAILGRSCAHVGAGVAAGLTAAIALENLVPGGVMGGRAHVILPVVACLMLTVGLLATLAPARRGLAVQPIEALRDD
jgi:putative ABC transport system permease protein